MVPLADRIAALIEAHEDSWFSFLYRWKLRRIRKNAIAGTQAMLSAQIQEATVEATEYWRQERLRQNSYARVQAETEGRRQLVEQEELADRLEEIKYRQLKRAVDQLLFERAAEYGLDLPTYLSMRQQQLSGGRSPELQELVANIQEAMKFESLASHTEVDLQRQELDRLHIHRAVLEAQPDSKLKKEQLKNLNAQIKANRKNYHARLDRLVETDYGEDGEGVDAPTGTNRDLRKKKNRESR
jgi:hypothetical protein